MAGESAKIFDQKAWKEDYILRALLQYNKSFKIVFLVFFGIFFDEKLESEMPLCVTDTGESIWIKKIAE